MFESEHLARIVAMGIILTAIPVHLVVSLLTPGRKGDMRTQRTRLFPGMKAEDALRLIGDRMTQLGFVVDSAGGNQLSAHRDRRSMRSRGRGTESLSVKKFLLTATAKNSYDGTEIELSLWMKDFIIQDTGEGQYIDALRDRILDPETAQAPPPLVAMPSGTAHAAMYDGGLSLLATLLLLFPAADGKAALDIGVGIGVASATGIMIAIWGIVNIRMRPSELTGTGTALLGLTLSVIALVVAGAAISFNTMVPA